MEQPALSKITNMVVQIENKLSCMYVPKSHTLLIDGPYSENEDGGATQPSCWLGRTGVAEAVKVPLVPSSATEKSAHKSIKSSPN